MLAIIRQISGTVTHGSAGDFQEDERQLPPGSVAIIRQMSGQVTHGYAGDYQADELQVPRGSAGDYQADEWAGVAWLSWRLSGR